ncbi:BRCT domain-containing protein [Nonomuraea insulae]|uniref:BRCT domain-containing protein n=1 Tax=Nonomuraea insulae TaxID=1616787 RepID=A0ABW1DD36_9ACTN
MIIEGCWIVPAGRFSRMSKDEAKRDLEALGAKVTASVSAKTDLVFAGAKSGAKAGRGRGAVGCRGGSGGGSSRNYRTPAAALQVRHVSAENTIHERYFGNRTAAQGCSPLLPPVAASDSLCAY